MELLERHCGLGRCFTPPGLVWRITEQSRALLTHLPQIPGDQSNNPSSSSFHLGSSSGASPQTEISFSCEEMQRMESHGKAQRQRRNICVSLLTPGGGIGVGNGTGPRVFLEILPCAKTRSIIKADLNFQHFCLSFLLVLFGFGEHLELQGQPEWTFSTRCWQ